MAGRVAYYGGIVTNGLILNLDAAKQDSYPRTGSVWRDISTQNRTGSLINGPIFGSNNGGNFTLDGVDDYANLGVFTGLGSSNRTLDVWFQVIALAPSGVRRVITFPADDGTNDRPAFMLGYTTTTSSLYMGTGGSPFNGYVTFTSFSLSTWTNAVASVNGSSVSVYKDGVLANTVTNTGLVGADPIGYIGRYNNNYGQYSNMLIASLKLYNRNLSAQEITQNYNTTKTRFGL
jgi:hypothetical protein